MCLGIMFDEATQRREELVRAALLNKRFTEYREPVSEYDPPARGFIVFSTAEGVTGIVVEGTTDGGRAALITMTDALWDRFAVQFWRTGSGAMALRAWFAEWSMPDVCAWLRQYQRYQAENEVEYTTEQAAEAAAIHFAVLDEDGFVPIQFEYAAANVLGRDMVDPIKKVA